MVNHSVQEIWWLFIYGCRINTEDDIENYVKYSIYVLSHSFESFLRKHSYLSIIRLSGKFLSFYKQIIDTECFLF